MRIDTQFLDFLKRFFVSRKDASTLEGTLSPASDGLVDLGEPHRKFGTIYADRVFASVKVDHGETMGLKDLDHPASAIIADTANFDTVLSSADDTVQKALDTLDDIDLAESDTVIFYDTFDELSNVYLYEHTPNTNLRSVYWSDESPNALTIPASLGYTIGPGLSELDFGLPVSRRKSVISIEFSLISSSMYIYMMGYSGGVLYTSYRILITNTSQELKRMPTTVLDSASESIDYNPHTLDIIVESSGITVNLDGVEILSSVSDVTFYNILQLNLSDSSSQVHTLSITTTSTVVTSGDHPFTDHRDVPSSYSGDAGYNVVVRSDEKGLGFQENNATYVNYNPGQVSDWESSTDPGQVDDALDQLAARLTTEEAHSHAAPDAADVTYTPAVVADWDGSADPGNVDDALDQLASRVTDSLKKDITLYVNGATGDDGNDGLSSGSPLATIMAAVNKYKGYVVSNCKISIAAGDYSELVLVDGISSPVNTDLQFQGDMRETVGVCYMHGGVHYNSSSGYRGAGTMSLATDNSGTGGRIRVTVTATTTNPDFQSDGIVAGDNAYVWDGTTLTEYAIYSVASNVVTLDSTSSAPSLNTNGRYFAVHPNVRIINASTLGFRSDVTCRLMGIYAKGGNSAGFYLLSGSFVMNNCIGRCTATADATAGVFMDRAATIFTSSTNLGIGWNGLTVLNKCMTQLGYGYWHGYTRGVYSYSSCDVNLSNSFIAVGPSSVGVYAGRGSYIYAIGRAAYNWASTKWSPATTDTLGNNMGAISFS